MAGLVEVRAETASFVGLEVGAGGRVESAGGPRTGRGPGAGGKTMRRLTVCVSVACAALVAIVAVTATGGAQQPGPPSGGLELVLRERESSFTFVDNPPLRRESRGDMAVIAGRLRDTDGAFPRSLAGVLRGHEERQL
jgi:hypothetical protein